MTRRIPAKALSRLVDDIFRAVGSDAPEAAIIADHLVTSSLVGHDSHGILRVSKYVEWVREGDVIPNRHAAIAFEKGPATLVDGGFGYGQVIGLEAMEILAERALSSGLAALGIRNTAHLGRIGHWAEHLAAAGLVSVHFVNTSGFGILVAPHGGSDRRLSANPFAAGAPRASGAPIVLDIATSVIAEGKIQVARNKGERLPAGAVLDGQGRPTRDASAFYGDPPGAILPFGGHKGSGLSFFCELIAGALSGGHASNPASPTAGRLVNNMVSIAFDRDVFGEGAFFAEDEERLIAWMTGSPPADPAAPVLLPGEIEIQTRAEREAHGIPVDDATWAGLAASAASCGLNAVGYI
ncbi:MAG: malate/lactate/ureidoglycolate dehydrogenase [Albidovulum sp.]|nr:malate/lactate/ureidoglycolate dehydrogenase [Albidovulum sp.]